MRSKNLIKRGGILLATTAIVLIGGFFVVSYALAAHTTTSTVDRTEVKGGSIAGYDFTVINNGADPIYKITVNAASGFSIDASTIVCPSNLNKDVSSSVLKAVCASSDPFDPASVLPSGSQSHITFSATAPIDNALLAWNIVTKDSNMGAEYTDTGAETLVDSLSPTTTADLGVYDPATGWTKDTVTVTLTSVDTGSDVASILYSTGVSAPSISYTTPFQLSESGIYPITYSATDNVGNVEPIVT